MIGVVFVATLLTAQVSRQRDLVVAPDLATQAAKWKRIEIAYDDKGLSARERQMVEKLVEASQYINRIYWRQSDPEGLQLYMQFAAEGSGPNGGQISGSSDAGRKSAGSTHDLDQALLKMLRVNGSRYDLLNNNQAFACRQNEAVGGACPPAPPGRALYPPGVTREQIEQYVAAHPGQKAGIYDEHTIVRRVVHEGANAAGNALELTTAPYRSAYGAYLQPAADALRAAADLSDDAAFAKFLRLRADALLTDDYYESDLAWLELNNPKFDIIFAPYETYLDDLLGVKTSYGAAVMIRNEAESRKLELYQKYVADIQEALPVAPEFKPSKRGHLTPMEVMNTPFRAGDLRYGYQAVADNLPNDPRVHAEKGTKKLFFKDFMDARVDSVILPLARIVMQPEQAQQASAEGYMATTVMHEICHGLGPDYARVNRRQVDIREAIGPAYSGLEEAKADVVGMFALKWLVDHQALPASRLNEFYASEVAGIFRTLRFGIGEAHGRAEMMEFNYYLEQGAIAHTASGRFSVDYAKMPAVIEKLANELLEQEATGDRGRAEAWFKKYDVMPPELQQSLKSATAIPVDFEPVFHWPDAVR